MANSQEKPGTGNLKQEPKVGEMVHGGFRSNRHHQGIEEMADDRSMGRELLTQTEDLYPDELLTQGYKEMLGSVEPGGTRENSKVSPWSRK